MFNILTLNKISKLGLDKLDSAKYICADSIEAPDAILVRSASMHEMELDANTVAIARAGAGCPRRKSSSTRLRSRSWRSTWAVSRK